MFTVGREVSIAASKISLVVGEERPSPASKILLAGGVTITAGGERTFTGSKITLVEGGEETTIESGRQEVIDTVETGLSVEVTPELVGDRIRLDGCVTTCESIDTPPPPSSNEEPTSYTFKKVLTPFSVVVAPGDSFVAIPVASQGDKTFEIALRVVRGKEDVQ